MLIFGHPLLESPTLYHINNIDALSNTPSNSIVCLEYKDENIDIIHYCKKNLISFALSIETIKELIFAENFDAKYIILNSNLAHSAQKIAEQYLFDAKILCRISSEDEIEPLAIEGIDGVLFKEAIVVIK